MRVMMFVVVDPDAAAEAAAAGGVDAGPTIDEWLVEVGEQGTRVTGNELLPVAEARTVRVVGDEVVVTDGPFTESKEWIAGFDILEVADLDEAVAIAARHPMARGGKLELRPFLPEGR